MTNGAGNVTLNAYDGLDRLFEVTDPVGRVTRFEYDLAGQQVREIRAYGTPLQQDYATYTYSPNGQRLSVTDANANRSAYVYDGFDRLSELHFPVPALGANAASATDYEAYGYDANSNRTSLRLRSGETIAFSYDALNREILRDLPGAAANDVYSAYDLAGRRLSARFGSAGGQGVVYAYDSAGRLASETSTLGTSRALGFQYDAASNRTRITWPDSVYAQYDYDALNRVAAIRENGAASGVGVLAIYAYDPLSRRASVTRGNGTVSTYSYDSASRLTGLTQDLSGGAANDQTYGFSYTAASQISQRTAANDNYNWTGPNVTRTYNRNGLNQYTSVSGTGFAYDARGNLTSDGSRTFAYDFENRLLSVTGSASFALAYDPLGRLRQSTANSISTDFLYDGDRLVAEYNGAGIVLRRYIHGPGIDEPLVWYEGSGLTDRRWLAADHLGSIIADEGASTTLYSYGPYGEPGSWTGSRFRYTGQIALPEVGLYHYRARIYDPVLGRFLQTDPIGYEEDVNLYAYTYNDPMNLSDPNGREAIGWLARNDPHFQSSGGGDTSRNGAVQGAAARAAYVGTRSEQVRGQYDARVAGLGPGDAVARSDVKNAARASTPPEVRAAAQAQSPLGPREGSGGTANRTNLGATQTARTLGSLGRGAGALAIITAGADIATADDPARATVANAGALGGALAGGEIGAQIGLLGGPYAPVTAPLGGFLGALAGGAAGYEGGQSLFHSGGGNDSFACGATLTGCSP